MKGVKMKMNYSKKKLLKALKSIKDGKYKICQASRIFNIPRQTLADKIKGRRPSGYVKPGPQAVLGTDVENKIEKWLLENARLGFPLNKEGLQYSVKHILDKIPEMVRSSIPFKNNTPGKGWFRSFRKRHPQVAIEYSDQGNKNKHFPTDVDLKDWYINVEKFMNEKRCLNILQDPGRIYVMNEFVIALSRDGSLRLVERKTSATLASKCYDENTFTVFLASNSLGEIAPPMVITKDQEIFDTFSNISDKWGVVFSYSCLMTCETFHAYITNVFHPHLKSKGVIFPITVFLNENCSCTSIPLTEFCEENGIVIFAIPRHFAQFLNPLDTALEFPLELFRERFQSKRQYDHMAQHPIISLMNDFLPDTTLEDSISKKFSSCGLFPFTCHLDSGTDESSNEFQIIKYYESKIPPTVLEEFKNCKSLKISWNGCPKYTALFNFWMHAVKDFVDLNKSVHQNQKKECEQLICLQFDEDLDDFIVEEEIEIN